MKKIYFAGICKVFRCFNLTLFLSMPVFVAAEQETGEVCNALSVRAQQQNVAYQQVLNTTDKRISSLPHNLDVQFAREYTYKVIKKIPHSINAFTQGLVYYKNSLYEGTGITGKSEIRQLNTVTGGVIRSQKTDEFIFGEGISIRGKQLFQLSWKSERAQIYDLKTLRKTGEIKYQGEGWGVTSVGESLVVSNGTSVLRWLNPDKKREGSQQTKEINITDSGIEVQGVNELEYVDGYIYANIWPTDCIAKINIDTGEINAWINLSALYSREVRLDWTAVLNGIAYNDNDKYFYVTGKYWPYIYAIKIIIPGGDSRV